MFCGTLKYMPPEVLVKQQIPYNQTIDVWALGAVAYELLTLGIPPFKYKPEDTVSKVLQKTMFQEPNYKHIEETYKNGALAIDFIQKCL